MFKVNHSSLFPAVSGPFSIPTTDLILSCKFAASGKFVAVTTAHTYAFNESNQLEHTYDFGGSKVSVKPGCESFLVTNQDNPYFIEANWNGTIILNKSYEGLNLLNSDYSADGKYFVISALINTSNSYFLVYNATDNTLLQSVPQNKYSSAFKFTSDSKYLIAID
jgi:hypothetical protein